MKYCIFGGQYGSEGKGSLAEWLINQRLSDNKLLVAFGENGPNSGHTCSLGKTQNLPVSAFYADEVVLGPNSAIHIPTLIKDLQVIQAVRKNVPRIRIHEHAAIIDNFDKQAEVDAGIIDRISSTGSGSGSARVLNKQFNRLDYAVINSLSNRELCDELEGWPVIIETRHTYLRVVAQASTQDCVFECSQGALLDNDWGIYPFVTSRNTLPRVATERNGVGNLGWTYVGVYRTYPIRTGGPSGPTGGPETTFHDIGVKDEIATVTKRKRRVFEFSHDDFELSLSLTRPDAVAFTHLDYINVKPDDSVKFLEWWDHRIGVDMEVLLSNETGVFYQAGRMAL